MVRTILCPTDLSDVSRRAIRFAAELAMRFGARVVLHHNVDAAPPSSLGVSWMWSEEHEHEAERELSETTRGLEELFSELPDVPVEGKLTRGPLDKAIHTVATEVEADLLVIATRDYSGEAHESETDRIVLRAPCPVIALGSGCLGSLTDWAGLASASRVPIVVPTDFEKLSNRAVDYAFHLANELPLELHLVHALGEQHRKYSKGIEERVERSLAELLPGSPDELQVTYQARWGEPKSVIAERVRETEACLVVMAAHRKSPLKRAVFGTTTLGVLHTSRVPIWYVPESAASAAPGARFREILKTAVE